MSRTKYNPSLHGSVVGNLRHNYCITYGNKLHESITDEMVWEAFEEGYFMEDAETAYMEILKEKNDAALPPGRTMRSVKKTEVRPALPAKGLEGWSEIILGKTCTGCGRYKQNCICPQYAAERERLANAQMKDAIACYDEAVSRPAPPANMRFKFVVGQRVIRDLGRNSDPQVGVVLAQQSGSHNNGKVLPAYRVQIDPWRNARGVLMGTHISDFLEIELRAANHDFRSDFEKKIDIANEKAVEALFEPARAGKPTGPMNVAQLKKKLQELLDGLEAMIDAKHETIDGTENDARREHLENQAGILEELQENIQNSLDYIESDWDNA